MGLGIRSLLFIALFSISFSAEARSFRLSKLLRAIGCGQLLSAEPHIDKVHRMLGDIGSKNLIMPDPEDEDLVRVRAHIYLAKEFLHNSVSPDVTDEFNFNVSATEVLVGVMDSKMSNRAFHILDHLPERFPYARKKRSEYVFDVKYLPAFIAEIRKLGFAFY